LVGVVAGEESHPLGRPSGALVGGDGQLWVADALGHNLRRIDLATGETQLVGREGQGPGEFRRPEAIAVRDGALIVLDFGNRRLQTLTERGVVIDVDLIEGAMYLPIAVAPDGSIVTATLGEGDALALIHSSSGRGRRTIGKARAPPPVSISGTRIREQVSAGLIPREFMNNVLPIARKDGGAWLVSQVDGTIQAFDASGVEEWEAAIPEGYVAGALERFFEAWAPGVVSGVPVPWIARAGTAVGGELWLVTDAPDGPGSHLLVYSGDTGELKRRANLEMAGYATCIAVDVNDPTRVFVCSGDQAAVLQYELPVRQVTDTTE
jgi:hypothetical protein